MTLFKAPLGHRAQNHVTYGGAYHMFGESLVHLDYILGHVLHDGLQMGLIIRAVVLLRGSLLTWDHGQVQITQLMLQNVPNYYLVIRHTFFLTYFSQQKMIIFRTKTLRQPQTSQSCPMNH